MNVQKTDFVVFDVETTGLYPKSGDRVIELGAVKIKGGKPVASFERLINPERDLPLEAQDINHITPDMVEGAPVSAEVLPEFIDFVGGACLVAHNAKFDIEFLCSELALAGRRLRDEIPVLDTLKMAKMFLPHLASHRLAMVAQNFGLTVGEAHRALADAGLTASVFSRLTYVAERQGITSLQQFIKEFGVPKPNYKIESVVQEFLF